MYAAGRIHVIGLAVAVIPLFMPQRRLTYWKQELGFTVHEPPELERVRSGPPSHPDSDEGKT